MMDNKITYKDNEIIYKQDAMSVINILTDKMADENIDVAAEQFISAINDLRSADTEYEELREKLRKERKKKKRWKNKYLKLIVDFNLLRDSYAELQSMYSELRTKYEQCGPINITFTKKDKDNIDE